MSIRGNMSLPLPPFNPNQPIPNDPFYAPRVDSLSTGDGTPLIIGAGLFIDFTTGTISATGAGGGVSEVLTGPGLTGGPITTTGTISLAASGVTSGAYVFPSITVDNYGRITTIADGSTASTASFGVVKLATPTEVINGAEASKAVTSVGLQQKLSDATNLDSSLRIASSKALKAVADSVTTAIPCSAFTACGEILTGSGASTYYALPVGLPGQILKVCDGCPSGMAWSDDSTGADIPCSIITGKGSMIAGSGSATPVAIPPGTADQILIADPTIGAGVEFRDNPAICCSILGGAGSLITASGAGTPVELALGTNGYLLTANSACPSGLEWAQNNAIPCSLVAEKGYLITATGPNNLVSLPVAATCDGMVLTANSLCLSGLEWRASGVASAIPCACLTTAKGSILTRDGSGTICSLPASANDGYILKSDSTCALGLYWAADDFSADIPCALIVNPGDMIVTDNNNAPSALPVGTDGQVLKVCTACTATGGVYWGTDETGADIPCACLNATKGTLLTRNDAGVITSLPPSVTDGYILKSDSTCACGLYWSADDASADIPCSLIVNPGDIIVTDSTNAPSALPVGTDGQVLKVCTACTATGGVYWGTDVTGQDVPLACYTNPGDILVATAADTPTALSVGTDGQVLQANSACTEGVYWATPSADIPCNLLTATGQIIVATGADTPTALPVGTNGQVLQACDTCTEGVYWATPSADIPCSLLTATGDLIVATGSGTPSILTAGTDGQVLQVCGACTEGVYWATPSADIPCSLLTATGDLIVATASGTPSALPVGTDGQVLKACAACTTTGGVFWATDEQGADIPCSLLTATGDLIVATAANTPSALPVGTDGQVLKACAACTTTGGLYWGTDEQGADIPCSILTAKGSLISATGAGLPVERLVGTDGHYLTVDLAAADGLCWRALPQATAESYGTVIGFTDQDNTGLGWDALKSTTTGNYNTALGACALDSNVTGSYNTAVGQDALTSNDSGCHNIAVGVNALYENQTGCDNTAVGDNAGHCLISACCNTFVGAFTGCGTTGSFNTLIGAHSGCLITTGEYNTVLGYNTQVTLPAGSCQLAIGFSPTDYWLTGDSTKAIKPGAGIIDCAGSCGTAGQVLMSDGSNAVCWGAPTGVVPATPTVQGIVYGCSGALSTALGQNALAGSPTGANNVAVGLNALCSGTGTANGNTAVGANALRLGAGAAENVAVGLNAMCNTTTSYWNTAIGLNALCCLTTNLCGIRNTAVGYNVMSRLFCGLDNVAVGGMLNALCGSSNTAVGANTLFSLNGGACNVAVGTGAGYSITSGVSNIAVGLAALNTVNTGGSNIAIGEFALYNVTSGYNNIGIGANVATTSATASNEVIIKTGINYTCFCGNATSWFFPSDQRDKTDIVALPLGLEFVKALEPRKYKWDLRHTDTDKGEEAAGFIAQEVLAVVEQFDAPYANIVDSTNPDRYAFAQTALIPMLVNAIKELSAKVDTLQSEVDVLKSKG